MDPGFEKTVAGSWRNVALGSVFPPSRIDDLRHLLQIQRSRSSGALSPTLVVLVCGENGFKALMCIHTRLSGKNSSS